MLFERASQSVGWLFSAAWGTVARTMNTETRRRSTLPRKGPSSREGGEDFLFLAKSEIDSFAWGANPRTF